MTDRRSSSTVLSESGNVTKHFDVSAFGDLPTDADREKVAAYFGQFADTRTDDGKVSCPGCSRTLYGDRGPVWQAMGLYTFKWGVAHGEGRCGDCGWPARGWPEVEISDGRVLRFPIPLPYHPDAVGGADHA